ncbi:MAG: hypothetical protein ACOYK8_04355 [Alphaproteobacteria bacterium]
MKLPLCLLLLLFIALPAMAQDLPLPDNSSENIQQSSAQNISGTGTILERGENWLRIRPEQTQGGKIFYLPISASSPMENIKLPKALSDANKVQAGSDIWFRAIKKNGKFILTSIRIIDANMLADDRPPTNIKEDRNSQTKMLSSENMGKEGLANIQPFKLSALPIPARHVSWYKGSLALDKIAVETLVTESDNKTPKKPEILIITPEGKVELCLTCRQSLVAGPAFSPQWHPSGEGLVVEVGLPTNLLGNDSPRNLWYWPLDGRPAYKLWPLEGAASAFSPFFSADGQKIYFAEGESWRSTGQTPTTYRPRMARFYTGRQTGLALSGLTDLLPADNRLSARPLGIGPEKSLLLSLEQDNSQDSSEVGMLISGRTVATLKEYFKLSHSPLLAAWSETKSILAYSAPPKNPRKNNQGKILCDHASEAYLLLKNNGSNKPVTLTSLDSFAPPDGCFTVSDLAFNRDGDKLLIAVEEWRNEALAGAKLYIAEIIPPKPAKMP